MWRILQLVLQNFVVVFLQKLCDFKMDLIKWQLNLVSCNFGLKSYFPFQIARAHSARSILKSCVWFQTKLHFTQFNYHYKLNIEIWHLNASFAKISQFDCYHSLWIHRAFTGKLSPNVEVLFLSEGKWHKKIVMYKVKRIVNAVNHGKVFSESQRHDISCIAFSWRII